MINVNSLPCSFLKINMTAVLFPISSIRKDLLKVSNNKDTVDGGFLEPPLLTDTSACTESTCQKKTSSMPAITLVNAVCVFTVYLKLIFGNLEKKNLLKFGVT